MESHGRSGVRHRLVLLAALPFALAGFMPAQATASDQGSSPVTSIDAAERADSSGPGSSAPSGSIETDGAGSSEESTSTEESDSSSQSGPDTATTKPADEADSEGPTVEEPVDNGSPEVTETGATVPKAQPIRAASDRPARIIVRSKVTICHRTNHDRTRTTRSSGRGSSHQSRPQPATRARSSRPASRTGVTSSRRSHRSCRAGMNWPEGESSSTTGARCSRTWARCPPPRSAGLECVGTDAQR